MIIRTQLKLSCELVSKGCWKQGKEIVKLIEKIYCKFSETISYNVDRILERTQKIDTGFIVIDEIYITEKPTVKKYFKEYYERLFLIKLRKHEIQPYLVQNKDEFSITQKIGLNEILTTVNQLPMNKAPGISGVTIEMIKNSSSIVQDWLHNCLNIRLRLNEIPKCILRSHIRLIPKGIYNSNPVNTRSINQIDIILELFSIILVKRPSKVIEHNNLLKGINFGFREGMSAFD